MRVLAISDSDSYLKWSHALLQQAPADWLRHEVVLRTVIAPSAAQITAATGRDLPVAGIAEVVARVRRSRPDAVLLACTGPALEVVVQALQGAGLLDAANPGRPVLVAGLPGIAVPASPLALQFRRACDLLVVHSHREVTEHQALAGDVPVALARMPFLPQGRQSEPGGRDVVFAAQSLVPPGRADRQAIVTALGQLPDHFDPVIKVRAVAGERQAHNEAVPYPSLVTDPRIRCRAGSMVDALHAAGGFVTVSSTAVLEAIALQVPALVLSDFGVGDEMINTVFEGSGLLGSLADLTAGRFAHPDPQWLQRNYFHDPGEDTWIQTLTELVARPREPVHVGGFGGPAERVRRWLRVLAPSLRRR